jgi:metal-dependent hydrolase (beta-lactamase superfamily II)
MSIGVPEQILQNSEQLAGIVEVLGGVHNFTLEIQEMSRAIKRMDTQSEGNLQPL